MQIISKEQLWAKVEETTSASATNEPTSSTALEDADFLAPDPAPAIDIPRLRSALASLDPDCDERTWVAYRIAPLANAALEHPDFRGQLYELAWQFSSGMLADKPAQTWTKKTAHGGARRGQLAGMWQRFLRSKYAGRPVRIESIFFHARQEGWDPLDDFEEVTE